MPLLRFWSHHSGIVSGRRAIARSSATNGRTVYTGSAAPIVDVSAAVATLGSSTSTVVANSRISGPPSFGRRRSTRTGGRAHVSAPDVRKIGKLAHHGCRHVRSPARPGRSWTDAGTPSTGKWRGEREGARRCFVARGTADARGGDGGRVACTRGAQTYRSCAHRVRATRSPFPPRASAGARRSVRRAPAYRALPQARWYIVTTQAPPRPRLCWRAVLAPSTWRGPHWPRSCWFSSKHWARPVAPRGWPLESRPPDGFTTHVPP